MRQPRRPSTIPPNASPLWRSSSLREWLAGAIALLLLVSSLVLAPPQGSRSASQGLGLAVSDCLSHDPAAPPGERRNACGSGALCCAGGCDSSASIGVPAGRQTFILATAPEEGAARRSIHANRFLALAGWASAWSSRAPPRA
jgi:hypothetical protein